MGDTQALLAACDALLDHGPWQMLPDGAFFCHFCGAREYTSHTPSCRWQAVANATELARDDTLETDDDIERALVELRATEGELLHANRRLAMLEGVLEAAKHCLDHRPGGAVWNSRAREQLLVELAKLFEAVALVEPLPPGRVDSGHGTPNSDPES